jgi:5'-deoxy-5'-methylthioadenosine phosphorylase
MKNTPPLGIIAGTGFYDLDTLRDPAPEQVATRYGAAQVIRGSWHELPVVFLTRHGPGHSVPPHLVNYRANVASLRDLGCTHVVAVNVVGGIDPNLPTGTLVCLDDVLDFTRSRVGTFHDGAGPEGVVHVDMLEPYDAGLRAEILRAARTAGIPMRDGGIYACFEGPRFETRAEIRMAAAAGATVAGMTGMPEATLAKEAGLRYAAVSLVVNPATGLAAEPITMEQIAAALRAGSTQVLAVLDALLAARAG